MREKKNENILFKFYLPIYMILFVRLRFEDVFDFNISSDVFGRNE